MKHLIRFLVDLTEKKVVNFLQEQNLLDDVTAYYDSNNLEIRFM